MSIHPSVFIKCKIFSYKLRNKITFLIFYTVIKNPLFKSPKVWRIFCYLDVHIMTNNNKNICTCSEFTPNLVSLCPVCMCALDHRCPPAGPAEVPIRNICGSICWASARTRPVPVTVRSVTEVKDETKWNTAGWVSSPTLVSNAPLLPIMRDTLLSRPK